MKKLIAVSLVAILLLDSCVMFLPNNSKVKFTNAEPDARISTLGVKYKATDMPAENFKVIGTGDCVGKLNNNRPISVITAEKDGYKTKNFVAYKTKFNPFIFIDIPVFVLFFPVVFFEVMGKFHKKYAREMELSPLLKYPEKSMDECFVQPDKVSLEMKAEDFTIVTVTKPEYLINRTPFTSTSYNVDDVDRVNNQESFLGKYSETRLADWGYLSKIKANNTLKLKGKIKKMEFLFYQGFLIVNLLCEWTANNPISSKEVFKKEFTSKSNCYKIFSAGYTKRSEQYDVTIDKAVEDVFESSLIEVLNDESYLKASRTLTKTLSGSETKTLAEISAPAKKVTELKESGKGMVTVVADNLFATGTLIGNEGYAITSLDILLNESKKSEVIFSDGKKSSFKLIQTNPNFNAALIKIDDLPVGFSAYSLTDHGKILDIGTEIYLISYNYYDASSNQSLNKGIISSSYVKENINQYQIDISFNKWNDGAPVLTKKGEFVGIVLSKINADKQTTATVVSVNSITKVFNIILK